MTSYKVNAQTDLYLRKILERNKDSIFNQILNYPQTYRLQIIYTEINRDQKNLPSFKDHYFNYDPDLYFNPASMVKMPLAFLALEKINDLNIKDVHKNTTILFDSSESFHRSLYKDTTVSSGLPTMAHFIKRAFLVSENDPYNRLYQLLGQEYLNKNLWNKGYKDVRITRQFMGLPQEQNRITNPVRFVDEQNNNLYSQPAAINKDSFDFSREIKLGKAHYRRDTLIQEPFDFTKHNNLSLKTMQQLLQSVLFPLSVPEHQRFRLTKDDYHFLYQYLSQYPSETPDPKYDADTYYNSYVKFFFRNKSHTMPPHVRVFNKVGWSYGFLTDVSYVVDFENKIEYMLAATLYVNSDEILNDGKYDYNDVGYPFLYQLGQTIYQYELKRKRKFVPDLKDFEIEYEKRDPSDTRPVLKDVDN
ncbi:MAG: serine hydrolase [Flavisolibacter sp.]|jgi:hypothetical protein|nr:serine hydrolase [Flavisolibacter sp.]